MFKQLSVLLIFVVFFLSGCASFKIVSATAMQPSDEGLTIQIRTNKELEKYEGSFFAHHVYLKYITSNTKVKNDIDKPSKYWGFPFSSTSYETHPCEGKGYCYKWTIPLKKEVSLSGANYGYELKTKDEITIKVGGGTMHGAQLKSNTKIVIVP